MGQSPGSDVEATRENLAHASPQTLKLGPRRESRNDAAGAGGRARTGDATRDAA